jgi:FRG domain
VRRLQSQPAGWILDASEVTESVVRDYEERLVQQARLAGHGHPQNRRLADLEVLGILQHHGAATRLLDFTQNAFIALWFACRSRHQEYGVVLAVALDDAWRISTEEYLEASFAALLDEAEGRMTYWRPSALSPRMPAQEAFFLWSEVQAKDWSSLGTAGAIERDIKSISELSSEFVAIAVSPELKERMKGRWKDLLGYSEQTMFPDLDGFANTHAATQELVWDFFA